MGCGSEHDGIAKRGIRRPQLLAAVVVGRYTGEQPAR
jgi:hypothetical protein